ncbi:hypothetical protein GBAR_LOCUS11028 [Geodia barretti]|uniref:VOC domain-containing protein n=1 Tax=Geodia barretti TaxID=519541 RepID=A0AA35RVY8_GEOBA|nr:hypothetical protein GBAR_LOCUS11028 [Geodia barretti]
MFSAGDTGEPDDGRRITDPRTMAPALEPAQIAPPSHAAATASNKGDAASTECRRTAMFEFIHHVRILVHDADAMAEYIEENFGMTPVKIEVFPARGMKNAVYRVGQTNVEFTEPLDP